MALTLVTGPTDLPLDINEVKAHLRVEDDQNDEDALILSYLNAAIAHIDGRDGWLGRALMTQTWDLTLDRFPGGRGSQTGYRGPGFASDAIRVPLPPLQSVTSITYTDTDGDEQTLAASKYTVDTDSAPGRIVPVFNEDWPSTRGVVNAVTVRFVAGYGARNDVPTPIRSALMLLTAHWYENREPVMVGQSIANLPMTVDALLTPYMVLELG